MNRSLFIVFIHGVFLLIVLVNTNSEVITLSSTGLETFYKQYDISKFDNERPECIENEYQNLCPTDNRIPCGPLDEIRSFCIEQLGNDISKKMKQIPKDSKENALEGCIRYVGDYTCDYNHFACCHSDVCTDFYYEQYKCMWKMDDDDDWPAEWGDDVTDDDVYEYRQKYTRKAPDDSNDEL